MNIKILNIIGIFIVGLIFSSCLKEDIIGTPDVASVKFYMKDALNKDSLVSQPVKGKAVKIVVGTDADICSVWPGGTRVIMKKKVSTDGGKTYADSIDMFNHPVLTNSDMYSDYGLVGAKGLKTTLSDEGWYCSYTYTKSGEFDLTVVVTNHGYNTNEFKQNVVPMGKVVVK